MKYSATMADQHAGDASRHRKPIRRLAAVICAALAIGGGGVAFVGGGAADAARPHPEGLAAATRACGNVGTQVLVTPNVQVNVVQCTITVDTPGTLYVSASADVLHGNNGASTQVANFGLTATAGSITQGPRSLTLTPGLRRALSTQGSIAVPAAGAQTILLFGLSTLPSQFLNQPAAMVNVVNASISVYFVAAGSSESACASPAPAATVPVAANSEVKVAECVVTVPQTSSAAVTASSGITFANGKPIAQSRIVVDGVTVPNQVSEAFDPTDGSTSFTTHAQVGIETLSPGQHTIQYFITNATGTGLSALVPSVMLTAAPTGSEDVKQCVTGPQTPTALGGANFTSVVAGCTITSARAQILQITATAGIEAGAAAVGEFQLLVDGALVPSTSRPVVVSTGNDSRHTMSVQFTKAVPAGAHPVSLQFKRTSGAAQITVTNPSIAIRLVTDTPPGGNDYVPVVPDRVLDTRPGVQVGYTGAKPTPGQTVQLKVTNVGTSKVPDNAGAVVLNVTGTESAGGGFVTVWPCGTPQPNASNLNLDAGATAPNLVVSKIGAGGLVCLFTQSSAHLIADVNGFMPAASKYTSVVPERLLDTRAGMQIGFTGAKPAAGATVTVTVAGAGNTKVPATAKAAVLNVTATEADAGGFVTVWPCGTPRPTASNLNIPAGGTAPNLVVSKLGTNGTVCIFVQSAMHLIADVNGFMPVDSGYVSVVPERLLETRTDGQAGFTGGKPAAGSTVELTVIGAGTTKVPAGTNAVVLNVTGIEPDADGFVTVWPCGSPRPTASNLNLSAGGVRPNLVMSKIGDGGKVCIFTQASTHLIADVSGFWP